MPRLASLGIGREVLSAYGGDGKNLTVETAEELFMMAPDDAGGGGGMRKQVCRFYLRRLHE